MYERLPCQSRAWVLSYGIMHTMKKVITHKAKSTQFPVLTSRGEDGFYVVQCPVLPGCFTQGKTLDEALKNIREAISLCLEEKGSRVLARGFDMREVGLHSVSV